MKPTTHHRSARRQRTVPEAKSPPERIQKVLASLGIASRRTIESWLSLGRIRINGQVVGLGDKMCLSDRVMIDGKLMRLPEQTALRTRILLLHKPEGVVCTRSDPEGRPTIFSFLPHLPHGRWVNVGRLDFNTAGLLVLTNDGGLAHRLMHPSFGIEREYAVRVIGVIPETKLDEMKQGVELEDGLAKFKAMQDVGGTGMNHWYHVVLTEGRQREVRRIFEAMDIKLNRLIRVRFGSVWLPKTLRKGKYQELTREEVAAFLATLASQETDK